MNLFDAKSICKRVGEFAWVEAKSKSATGGITSLESVEKQFRTALEKARLETSQIGMSTAAGVLQRLYKRFDDRPADFLTFAANAETARSAVIGEFDSRKFLYVAPDRIDYIDQERLFGDKVYNNFESARDDVCEAGNCLAAECGKAAVFHAIRAAEIGLRALGYARRVRVFKNKKTMLELPLELATWDQIIKELEDAESAIQGYPQTLAREEQFAFYHGAMMQFRAFKNVFRNAIMHSREVYDRHVALRTVEKVREFMQILATKIKEGDQTPEIWTA